MGTLEEDFPDINPTLYKKLALYLLSVEVVSLSLHGER